MDLLSLEQKESAVPWDILTRIDTLLSITAVAVAFVMFVSRGVYNKHREAAERRRQAEERLQKIVQAFKTIGSSITGRTDVAFSILFEAELSKRFERTMSRLATRALMLGLFIGLYAAVLPFISEPFRNRTYWIMLLSGAAASNLVGAVACMIDAVREGVWQQKLIRKVQQEIWEEHLVSGYRRKIKKGE